ncbi:MAG: hypothetical protein M0R49_05155 [Limnochordia bacterium]|jgi:hypothetical protein|nr:hypothetical protein [Limnochordia bacterium]
MNQIRSLAKYQLSDNRNGLLIFYAILIAIALVMIAISSWEAASGHTSLSGSSIVFLFVIGLNCFRPSFLFAQANNISRRTFYFATILSLVGLAVIVSLADFVMDSVMSRYPFYYGIFDQIYAAPGMTKILWTMAMLTFSASLGWMITMLYYRANAWVKVLISVSPLVFIILASYIHQLTGGTFGYRVLDLLARAFGFSAETPNPYPAIATLTLTVLVIWAINYLLMRKTPVRAY